MTAQSKTSSLLVGLSTTLREPVLDAMVDATTVAVVVDQDEPPGGACCPGGCSTHPVRSTPVSSPWTTTAVRAS